MPPQRITTALCVIVLLGILAAGLWPFHVPRNAVAWLPGAAGLRFNRFGSVFSDAAIPDAPGEACTLEVWVQPANTRSATILSFFARETPRRFALLQLDDELLVVGDTLSEANRARIAWIDIPHAVRKPNTLTLLTVTSGKQTSIYLNGVLVETKQFHLVRANFAGRLVLGTSPVGDDGWSGQLRGIALYDRELPAKEVAENYRKWSPANALAALYRFDEHRGDVVHDAVSPGVDLHIPEYFTIPQPTFLESPWSGFRNTRGYWRDVLVNIGGFIPFGFLFGVYFSSVRPVSRPIFTTILLGALVTLLIETTQAWLPTRDSSMTDVLTNILGTAIGAVLQRSKVTRSLYDWVVSGGGPTAG